MTNLISTTFALLLATSATIATVGIATPAFADPIPTVEIAVGLHNLGNPAVRAKVESQVRRAARRLCTANGHRPIAAMMAEHACIETAVAGALPQVEMLAARSTGGMVAAATVPTDTVSQ